MSQSTVFNKTLSAVAKAYEVNTCDDAIIGGIKGLVNRALQDNDFQDYHGVGDNYVHHSRPKEILEELNGIITDEGKIEKVKVREIHSIIIKEVRVISK